MSKASRRRRARDRIDVRLWEGRAKNHDLLLWQVTEWNRQRIQMLERWEKSRKGLYHTIEQEVHWDFFYKQLIHKGRKA